MADPRDIRIDRAVTWTLTTVAGVALTLVAWAFNSLTTEIHGMRTDLAALVTKTAVLEEASAELKRRIDRLERTQKGDR